MANKQPNHLFISEVEPALQRRSNFAFAGRENFGRIGWNAGEKSVTIFACAGLRASQAIGHAWPSRHAKRCGTERATRNQRPGPRGCRGARRQPGPRGSQRPAHCRPTRIAESKAWGQHRWLEESCENRYHARNDGEHHSCHTASQTCQRSTPTASTSLDVIFGCTTAMCGHKMMRSP